MDDVFIGSKARNLSASPKQAEYTGVIINTSDETFVSAGDISSSNAKVLEVSANWATVADAQRILSRLRGFKYQPYTANGALLNPAAELGDGITVGKIYSGIYSQDITFSPLMASDVSAPQEEQIDNEYKFVSPQKREYKRKFAEVRASIQIEADRITAEVERATAAEGTLSTRITQTADAITSEVTRATEAEETLSSRITQTATDISAEVQGVVDDLDDEVERATAAEGGKLDHTHASSTFGWELTASAFLLKSNNSTVFKCDRNGIEVTGKVTAQSGYIGNGSNGFTISATAIYNGMESFSDTAHNGVYVGTDGIALGKGAFKVDSQGNLTANSGTFKGTVSANKIAYGGDHGTMSGSGITGGTITTSQTSSYINGGLADGYFSGDVFSGAATAGYCMANVIKAPENGLFWNDKPVYRHGFHVHDGDFIWALDAT